MKVVSEVVLTPYYVRTQAEVSVVSSNGERIVFQPAPKKDEALLEATMRELKERVAAIRSHPGVDVSVQVSDVALDHMAKDPQYMEEQLQLLEQFFSEATPPQQYLKCNLGYAGSSASTGSIFFQEIGKKAFQEHAKKSFFTRAATEEVDPNQDWSDWRSPTGAKASYILDEAPPLLPQQKVPEINFSLENGELIRNNSAHPAMTRRMEMRI